jgi:hypothetical protein
MTSTMDPELAAPASTLLYPLETEPEVGDGSAVVVAAGVLCAKRREWLATDEDRAFVASLMGRIAAPGAYANWIAPPTQRINKQPANFECVRFN